MLRFLPPQPQLRPLATPLGQQARYELVTDYQSDYHGVLLRIPRFFAYDGASIPRQAWGLTTSPFDPRVMTAALIHDWLYTTHQTTRAEADELFLAYLLAEPALSRHRAILMYVAVSKFGGLYYKQTPVKLEYLRLLKRRLELEKVDISRYRWPTFEGKS